MQRIPRTDPARLTGRAREQLDAVHRKMGRVPNLHATMANSPAVLNAYLCLNDALSHTSLDNRLRELLAVTVASANDCDYCLSAHTELGKKLKVDDAELMHAQEGESTEPKTRAALHFAKMMVHKRGAVGDEEISALKAAGFNHAAVLEIVATTAMNIFTNYVNHVAGTEVDYPRVMAPAK